MPVITCVDDLRELYIRRVPRLFVDYAESGSYSESTCHANIADFASFNIRQRVGRDISSINVSSEMAGTPIAMPVALAPIGMLGMQRAGGEILAAKAAEKFGIPFTLSTMSICSIEDVRAAVSKPFMFQLCVFRDRCFVSALIERARLAKCSALVIAMDLPILAQRHKDIKNGLSVRPSLRNLMDVIAHPGWAYRFLKSRHRSFGNIVGHAKGVKDLSSLQEWSADMIDPALSWQDIKHIQAEWNGKVILKGITEPDDARRAADLGIDAIIVSNHGGRQLDGSGSTIKALPAIVSAVGNRVEVFLDSGIRTGMDMFRACALGAKGVFVGRPLVYSLGALGEPGVLMLLDLLRREFKTTMGLAGKIKVSDIGPEDVYI